MDRITGLDDVKKRKFVTLQGLELRPLCRPARSQSLYGLRDPGFFTSSFSLIIEVYSSRFCFHCLFSRALLTQTALLLQIL
jgi:hypothetical protein